MDNYTKAAIKKLIAKRTALREEYNSVMSEPASYGITGSVNASNRSLAEISAEITKVDRQISVMMRGGNVIGISLPDYRSRGC